MAEDGTRLGIGMRGKRGGGCHLEERRTNDGGGPSERGWEQKDTDSLSKRADQEQRKDAD